MDVSIQRVELINIEHVKRVDGWKIVLGFSWNLKHHKGSYNIKKLVEFMEKTHRNS